MVPRRLKFEHLQLQEPDMTEEGRPLALRKRERVAPDLRELLQKQATLSQEVPRKPLVWPSENSGGATSRLRLVARSALCLVAVVPFMVVGMAVQALILKFWRNAAGTLPRLFLWWVRKVLGVRVIVQGKLAKSAPLLVVSNHVSWLDIVILGGLAPISFVAKSEVATWPVIGTLARLHRAIFVDRARRSSTFDMARLIGHRLVAGDTIVLFGEGTTSDGNRVLPFRPALLASVREAMSASGGTGGKVLVQPLSIVYSGLDGLPLGRADRPSVAWYGDMTIASHLKHLLSIGPVDVTLRFGEAFEVTHGDRKALAKRLGDEVRVMAAEIAYGRSRTAPAAERAAG
jgi:1-acyl-sn-glycerol-3-phosphate acyltransferase